MAPREDDQEQDITVELCTSPKTDGDENNNSSDSARIEKNVTENAMDLIFSSASIPDQERGGGAEKEEAISELLLSGTCFH